MLDELTIRRTVPIPKVVNNKQVLALIEVGSKIFGSKDVVYQKFFEFGFDLVQKDIIQEIKRKGGKDELFDEAVKIVCQYDRASASLLQRRLSIGYARAARILDQLEGAGIVSPAEGSKPRDVLIQNADEFLSQKGE